MKSEIPKNTPEVGEEVKSLDQLKAERQKWARFTIGFGCCVVVALGGLAWGIKDWLAPDVSTRDTWTLPLALVFFVDMAGMFAFSLQELRKVSRQIKGTQAK